MTQKEYPKEQEKRAEETNREWEEKFKEIENYNNWYANPDPFEGTLEDFSEKSYEDLEI